MAAQYRIQAVSDMTGVPAPTLRAWERRYGVPDPARSPSEYRLYSERDVEVIRRFVELRAQGASAAEAARTVAAEAAEHSDAPTEGPREAAASAIVDATVASSPVALQHTVRCAAELGSAWVVFRDVLAPAMRRIGDEWSKGAITVAQEHMASVIIEGAARNLARLVEPDPGDEPHVALLACLADEQHVLALYGVAIRIAGWGYRSVILGARTPSDRLGGAARELGADLVGLSVTNPVPKRAAQRLLDGYAEALEGLPWLLGGQGAAGLGAAVERSGGEIAADDSRALRSQLARLRRSRWEQSGGGVAQNGVVRPKP